MASALYTATINGKIAVDKETTFDSDVKRSKPEAIKDLQRKCFENGIAADWSNVTVNTYEVTATETFAGQ